MKKNTKKTTRKEHIVNNDRIESQNLNSDINSNGSEYCFEVIKNEYDYCIKRADRLENKVYILLGISGFLCKWLIDIIELLFILEMPVNNRELVFRVVFMVSFIIIAVATIIMVIKLINLLSSMDLKRIDFPVLLEYGIPNEKDYAAVKFIGTLYSRCIINNNNILEKQFDKFNQCIALFFISSLGIIVLLIMKCLM